MEGKRACEGEKVRIRERKNGRKAVRVCGSGRRRRRRRRGGARWQHINGL